MAQVLSTVSKKAASEIDYNDFEYDGRPNFTGPPVHPSTPVIKLICRMRGVRVVRDCGAIPCPSLPCFIWKKGILKCF